MEQPGFGVMGTNKGFVAIAVRGVSGFMAMSPLDAIAFARDIIDAAHFTQAHSPEPPKSDESTSAPETAP